jgi:hypothetical protein
VTEKIIGSDTDKDGWTTEIVGEVQLDGTLLITGEHRYRTTIDGIRGAGLQQIDPAEPLHSGGLQGPRTPPHLRSP